MFGIGRKKDSINRQQALAAKPMHLVSGELVLSEDGSGKLKVPLRETGWRAKFLRVPEGATKTFELDAIGVLVWKQCDGKTSVQQIIRRLAKEYKLTLREVEVATVQFLQMLVKKGLIGMSMPGSEKKDQ